MQELNKVHNPSRVVSPLIELPMELHLHIQREFLRDPGTTFDDYKPLRLVCKTFDLIWSPIVLSRFSLIPLSKAKDDNILESLHNLSRSLGAGSQYQLTALTFAYWGCLNSDLEGFFERLKLKWYRGDDLWDPILILFQLFILPPLYLFRSLATPKAFARHLASSINRVRARRYVDEMPSRLQLPNVRCTRLYYYWNDSRWVIFKSTRMLLALSHLTELELFLSWTADMPYISECLWELRTLHKFSIYLHPECLNNYLLPKSTRCFSTLIARNRGLTSLRFLSDLETPFDFSELLRNVPSSRPLRLEHLSIDSNSTNLRMLVPHLSSLRSFEFESRPGYYVNTWCQVLAEAHIFPPHLTIKTYFFDGHLLAYLNNHPGIESLTIHYSSRPGERHSALSQILALHAKTLRRLAISSHMLAVMRRRTENEINLLKCTSLSEVVLFCECGTCVGIPTPESVEDEKDIFLLISHLNRSLTLTVRSREMSRYQDCVRHCRDSENPLVRDLAGRIVYEKYVDWQDHFRTFQWRPELYQNQGHDL